MSCGVVAEFQMTQCRVEVCRQQQSISFHSVLALQSVGKLQELHNTAVLKLRQLELPRLVSKGKKTKGSLVVILYANHQPLT